MNIQSFHPKEYTRTLENYYRLSECYHLLEVKYNELHPRCKSSTEVCMQDLSLEDRDIVALEENSLSYDELVELCDRLSADIKRLKTCIAALKEVTPAPAPVVKSNINLQEESSLINEEKLIAYLKAQKEKEAKESSKSKLDFRLLWLGTLIFAIVYLRFFTAEFTAEEAYLALDGGGYPRLA